MSKPQQPRMTRITMAAVTLLFVGLGVGLILGGILGPGREILHHWLIISSFILTFGCVIAAIAGLRRAILSIIIIYFIAGYSYVSSIPPRAVMLHASNLSESTFDVVLLRHEEEKLERYELRPDEDQYIWLWSGYSVEEFPAEQLSVVVMARDEAGSFSRYLRLSELAAPYQLTITNDVAGYRITTGDREKASHAPAVSFP